MEGTAFTCLNNEEFINQYNNVSIPAGGLTGEVLTKISDSDNDVEWIKGGSGDFLVTQVFS